jgi:hypothetical protein
MVLRLQIRSGGQCGLGELSRRRGRLKGPGSYGVRVSHGRLRLLRPLRETLGLDGSYSGVIWPLKSLSSALRILDRHLVPHV